MIPVSIAETDKTCVNNIDPIWLGIVIEVKTNVLIGWNDLSNPALIHIVASGWSGSQMTLFIFGRMNHSSTFWSYRISSSWFIEIRSIMLPIFLFSTCSYCQVLLCICFLFSYCQWIAVVDHREIKNWCYLFCFAIITKILSYSRKFSTFVYLKNNDRILSTSCITMNTVIIYMRSDFSKWWIKSL